MSSWTWSNPEALCDEIKPQMSVAHCHEQYQRSVDLSQTGERDQSNSVETSIIVKHNWTIDKKDKHMLKWADTYYVELGWIICWTDVLNILAGHIADSDSSLTSIIGILSSSAPRVKKISLEAFSFSATWPWPQQWVTSQDISGCFRHGH